MATEYLNSIADALKVQKIEEKKCKVVLDANNMPNHVIIHLDHIKSPVQANSPKCDFIFASDGNGINDIWQFSWIVPIELKGGKFDSSKVVKQLRAGAEFMEKRICSNCKFDFMPLLAHGSGNIHNLHKLKGQSIKFRGKKYPVKPIKCGGSLSSALAEYKKDRQ